MAKELALGLVIGGAVSKSVGAAFKDVEGRIKGLETTAGKAKVLQSVIGETKKLQDEWRKAHLTGAATAEGLRRKLDTNLETLRRQGVEVRNLGKAYEKMGRKARLAELKSVGHAQLKQGATGLRNTAVATAGAAAATMIVPTKVSAEFGAVIRDIAIKAGIANTPEERQMSSTIIDTSRNTGMARNQVADVVNALVGAGMDLKQAMQYAPVAAKFVVGQGADGTDTAKMINALGQNAKITDPRDMQKALEAIAFQGQAGSFEAADMAKWFPELLAGMGKLGIFGNDAVSQLGAMLQVQMKTAGSSDEAANNLKNWMEKIGSSDVVKSYKDAGIDYQGSMDTGLQKGMSTLESSFALAQKYVEATDPKKAKSMAEAMAKISQEADPAKAKEMMSSLEQALRTGDLFSDMQVKAALTAYMQNKQLYQQLKKDSAEATGILDKNLAERRDASAQKWSETGQALDDVLRSAGDAMRPLTDKLSTGLTDIAKGIAVVSDKSPVLVTGLLGVGAAIATISAAYSTFKIAKGLMNIGRGTLMGNPNLVQKVAVVNGLGGGGGLDFGGGSEKTKGKRWGRRSRASSNLPDMPTGSAKPRMRVYAGGGPQTPKSLSGWTPPTSTPKSPATSVLKASGPTLGGLAGGRGNVAAALFDAAISAKEVYDTAETKDEKAEGYGAAAGQMAGTLAGAAAGAAIGSVVPIIGTAIGGLIGAYVGSMGGSALGGVVGRSLFGGSDESVTEKSEPPPTATAVAAATTAQAPAAIPEPEPVAPALDPAVSYNPSDPNSVDPFVVKNPYGKRPRFPGASLANDPDRLRINEDMRRALAPAPMAAPTAVTRNGPSGAVPSMSAVADSFKEADPKSPISALMAPIKADSPVAAGPPKLEQSNTFSPSFNIVVQGDAKDPRELVNQMMPEIERHLAGLAQQTARREMSDQPTF
ncbi:MAG TPA: phage tail tape measure protein [Pseudomonas sp.]|uniref:phage tail tape measure protein n=1 Tax=Pseudomonas sp. TaxID=306 RepID=UPI002ED798EF